MNNVFEFIQTLKLIIEILNNYFFKIDNNVFLHVNNALIYLNILNIKKKTITIDKIVNLRRYFVS